MDEPTDRLTAPPSREALLTHADLGLAYREMGLVAEAAAEWIAVIAADSSFAAHLGELVLEQLSPFGWGRFASGSCR